MISVKPKKIIPLIITITVYIQLFIYYVGKAMWMTQLGGMEYILFAGILVILTMIIIFIRPFRRFYYPFAPILWGAGLLIVLFGVFYYSTSTVYLGFLFLIPAEIFMYIMYKFSS